MTPEQIAARYTLTQGETWHIVDMLTGEDFDTCETDVDEAKRALIQHAIYNQPE